MFEPILQSLISPLVEPILGFIFRTSLYLRFESFVVSIVEPILESVL